jgi:hypothetical protein
LPQTLRLEFAKSNTKVQKPKQTINSTLLNLSSGSSSAAASSSTVALYAAAAAAAAAAQQQQLHAQLAQLQSTTLIPLNGNLAIENIRIKNSSPYYYFSFCSLFSFFIITYIPAVKFTMHSFYLWFVL